MIQQIAERLDVPRVLDLCGIPSDRKRIPCPIHGGDGLNFAILGDGAGWKCFSHDCGAPHRRDAVNLYCLLRHGAPLPKLHNKGEAIRELASLAGIECSEPSRPPRPFNRFDEIPIVERQALAAIFDDTSRFTPEDLGNVDLYTSQKCQYTILFLQAAKSLGELPAVIDGDWQELPNLEAFIRDR